jgi:cytochrome c-type biogenesis protein CcmE
MSHKAIRISLTVTVMAVAFGALLYSSLGDNLQYYKYVDEVMAEPQMWHDKPLKVHGYVVPGSIARKPDTREYKFDLQRNGKVVTAYYTGTPPDGFKDDAEVVLSGTLGTDRFVANDMEAKCPSKYEEETDSKPKIIAWLRDAFQT